MFAYFLLRMAESVGLELTVDLYEPRFFTHRGPAGCNHCGGIISESLVQMLAAEGIRVYVDQLSVPYLTGTEIDYVTEGLNSSLKFRNPNATGECGCGESFKVD